MREYRLEKIAHGADIFAAAAAGACAPVDSYVWNGGYTPCAQAYAACSDRALRICLTAREERVRAVYTERNDPVYRDSCMEFFFSPQRSGAAYFNFEINALGTLYVGFSPTGRREHSRPIADAPDNGALRVCTRLCLGRGEQSFWQVSYDVPFDFIRRFVPDFGPNFDSLRANFYKCGEDTQHPHWGSWSPIGTPEPDFHTPSYFGLLVR